MMIRAFLPVPEDLLKTLGLELVKQEEVKEGGQ
jgi:hypothetical protein